MNDLMAKSFLSYVELKKQCQIDLEAEKEIEKGQVINESNLSQFFKGVEAIKSEMKEITITNLLFDIQNLNEETKSTHSAKVL